MLAPKTNVQLELHKIRIRNAHCVSNCMSGQTLAPRSTFDTPTRNDESVPKIIIKTQLIYLLKTATSTLAISNHDIVSEY